MRTVYFDNAATTPLDPRVRAVMVPFFDETHFGNPSAIYRLGREAKDAIEDAREKVAAVFGARAEEILFTGSGTESDNLAILGIARAHRAKGTHLITTQIEHHAVLAAMEHLEKKEGFSVTYLPVDADGRVSPEAVVAALTPETTLISIMTANNEIGTIEPIADIVAAVRAWKKANGRVATDMPYVHTDACQAAGYLDVSVVKSGVDLLTVNGSKIYGPKGTGALYVRRGVKIQPLVFGGGQEFRMRSGTENVAGIVGFAEALHLANMERETESARLIPLRDRLIAGIQSSIPKCILNGHVTERLPNNVNISILDIEGEAVLLYLDESGISAATGSACDSASLDPSHVILALGLPYEYAHASVRFTLGRSTTDADIDYVLEKLPGIVKTLRDISPVSITLEGEVTGNKTAFVGSGRPHWEKNS